jgi:two-component system response regulator RegA
MEDKLEIQLLIAEDDLHFGETLELEFTDRGYNTIRVRSLAQFESVASHRFDCAVIDLRLGADSGLDLVKRLHALRPRCRIVVLTGFGSIATAIKAMKLGAVNYLTKPASVTSIEAALLGLDQDLADSPSKSVPSLARHEREYIESVLTDCDGNISQAARRLGLHRQSLQRKLRKFMPA